MTSRTVGNRSFVAAALALASTACGINCDRNPDQEPVEWKGGVTESGGTPAGFYRSSEIGGPYLPFPPGRTYRFFHDLGGIPQDIRSRVAFSERCGNTERGVERSAEIAGNQVTLEQPTSPDYFDIRNDTCSDVCLFVTAENAILESEQPPEEPAVDAGDIVEPPPGDGG